MNPSGGRRWSCAAAALLLVWPSAPACQGTPGAPHDERPAALGAGSRVLMLGNSLTEGNGLGRMVEALARSAGLDWEVHAVTIPGAALEDHWQEGAALRLLRGERWDAVVLQQGPSALPESRRHLRRWAAEFDREIREAGGRAALYMVWPASDHAADFDRVRDSYALAARDVDGWFLPAGESWRAAWRREPSAPLYGPDGFHPTAAGSYAAALTIYAGLSGRSPVGLPSMLEKDGGTLVSVPPPLAELLQAAAAEAGAAFRDYRAADVP